MLPSFEEAEFRKEEFFEEHLESRFSIYPNPSSNSNLHLEGLNFEKSPRLEVVNQFGKMIFVQTLDDNNLNLNLSPGIYFLRLMQLGETDQIEKLIIQ